MSEQVPINLDGLEYSKREIPQEPGYYAAFPRTWTEPTIVLVYRKGKRMRVLGWPRTGDLHFGPMLAVMSHDRAPSEEEK